MGWPQDARFLSCSALLTKIPAALLNAMQDAINGIVGGGKSVVSLWVDGAGDATSSVPDGDISATGTVTGATGLITGGALKSIRLEGNSGAPGATNAEAGFTGGTVTCVGSNNAGIITFAGASATGGNSIVTKVSISTYTTAPIMILFPQNANAAALGPTAMPYVSATTSGVVTLSVGAAGLSTGTTYVFGYHVIGY